MNRNLILAVIVGIIVIAAVYAGLNMSGQPVLQQGTNTATPAASPEVKVTTFNVEARPFSFTPNEIRVKKGDTVRINFTNAEGFHDLVIDEFNARTNQLQAGQSQIIEFIADREGTFTYYCSVPGHRARGMEGKLIVE